MDPPITSNELQYESVQYVVPYEFMVSPNRLDLAPDSGGGGGGTGGPRGWAYLG